MNGYLIFKSLHIIGFVSWFAGLFYWVRMFVYHVEAEQKPSPEKEVLVKQFTLMERRVYKVIANPAMIITLIGGLGMFYFPMGQAWLKQPWMHAKLTLLVLLIGYHHYCLSLMKKLEKGTNKMSAEKLRFFNEIATLLLVAIVLLAVLKNMANFGVVLVVLVVLAFLFGKAIKAYKKVRLKEEAEMNEK